LREPSNISLSHITHHCLDDALASLDGDTTAIQRLGQYDNLAGGFFIDAILHNEAWKPLHSVLRIVRHRHDCFGIAEWPYFDMDVWEGFCLFYSYAFKQYKRSSRRIHFFEGPDEKADAVIRALKSGKTLSQIEKVGVKYKGFTVIRPLSSFVIGRTSLKFDERGPQQTAHIEKHNLENTGTPFCKGEFSQTANVCSTKLEIRAAPFIQQDPVIGVCASASVWAASQVLSNRFGLHKFPYGTITQQAFYSRNAPVFPVRKETIFGPGLNIQQISDALAFTGAHPFPVYPEASQEDTRSFQARFRLLSYTFVESGIPIILCFTYDGGGRHAVTLLGHLLPGATDGSDSAEIQAELTYGSAVGVPNRHCFVGQAIQLYYAHDDAYGPFNRISIFSDRDTENKRQSLPPNNPLKNKVCLLGIGGRERLASADVLVVGVPRYVQNSPEGVMIHAIKEFDRLCPDLNPELRVLWRCLLVDTGKFKRSLQLTDRRVPYALRRRYASIHLPKYVWLVEFSVGHRNDHSLLASRRSVDGEFLYDPTTPFWEPYCIAQRFLHNFRDCREKGGFEQVAKDPVSIPCFVVSD
jgi:hypothetical protein